MHEDNSDKILRQHTPLNNFKDNRTVNRWTFVKTDKRRRYRLYQQIEDKIDTIHGT